MCTGICMACYYVVVVLGGFGLAEHGRPFLATG